MLHLTPRPYSGKDRVGPAPLSIRGDVTFMMLPVIGGALVTGNQEFFAGAGGASGLINERCLNSLEYFRQTVLTRQSKMTE